MSRSVYESDGDVEKVARCLIVHLSMPVPRHWWQHAIQTNSTPDDSYIKILHSAQKELLKLPVLSGRVGFGVLAALSFMEPSAIEDPSFISIDEFLLMAEKILSKRPDLRELGNLMEARLEELSGHTEGAGR